MIGTTEIIILGAVVVLLFGASKLPELAESAGKSVGVFKKAKRDIDTELEDGSK